MNDPRRGQTAATMPGLLVLATMMAWTAPSHADVRYKLYQYPDGSPTLFLGCNAHGQVAGFTFSGISFSYSVKSKLYTPVESPAGYVETDVWNLNDAGTMVGGVWSADYASETAFFRDADGNYTLLAVPGWPNSEAMGINDRGVVVGQAFNADYTNYVGFIYDPARRHYTLVMPSAYTLVHGINSRGEIVGLSILDAGAAYPGSPAGTYGWYRATNGALTLFRGNGIDTYARVISEDGRVGGFLEDSQGNDTGFITPFRAAPARAGSRNFVALELGQKRLVHIPGTLDSFVQALPPNGTVVGVAIDTSNAIQGFVATGE